MENTGAEINQKTEVFIDFINRTKEGTIQGSGDVPKEYIIRYDFEEISAIGGNEVFEQYHFGLTN